MRTVGDWRDLPAVPRRAAEVKPCDHNCTPVQSGEKPRRKRTRFGDLCENQNNNAETDVTAPRKRPRPSIGNNESGEIQQCGEHVQVQGSSTGSFRSDGASRSPSQSTRRSSKLCIASPVSESNTTCDDTDGDSSDGEAVRRVVRRRRSKVKSPPVGSGLSRNASLAAGSSFERDVKSSIKHSTKAPRDIDNDSSGGEAVLRVIRRQRSHLKTTATGKCVSQNANSTPNESFENLLSSPPSVPRVATRNEPDDSSDEEIIRRVPRRRRKPEQTSHSANHVSQSHNPVSNTPAEKSISDPVKCSVRTPDEEGDDSSDEETVLRGTRRRRRHRRTSISGNDEEHARSSTCTAQRGYRTCSPSGHKSHGVISRKSSRKRTAGSPSDEKRAKRRRTQAPGESDPQEEHQCQGSSDLKHASSSVEHPSRDSTRGTEPEIPPRKACKYKAQRRRCPRQSTARSIEVPWYMLDEERIPYRLRSSSRNCAARCIFWTKTERRLFKVAKSRIHNRGLYALEDIPAFAPVIEYAGEIVTQVRSEIREWEYQSRHIDEVYMYQLQKGTTDVIDGTKRGGPAKFVNHSCEPNVVADEIKAGGTNRVWFFSLRPIRKGEEILLDYCLSYEPGDIKRPCLCGARKCKKYLNYYGLTE